jgi:hypothetical protein
MDLASLIASVPPTVVESTSTLFYKTVENAIASYLLGVLSTIALGIFYFKVPEKWDRVSDCLERLDKRDEAYRKLLIKLAKKGIDLKELDTDELY